MHLTVEILANQHPSNIEPQTHRFCASKCHLIMGASGAGKSSFLMAIAGLIKEIPVQVQLNRKQFIGPKKSVPIHRRPIIYQPHHKVLFEALSVQKNLEFAVKKRRFKTPLTQECMIEILSLQPLLDKMPSDLSGGQYQRVLLARTLLSGKAWVLLDEPSLHLDPQQQNQLASVLKKLVQDGQQHFIIVTHSLSFAANLGQLFYSFQAGKLTPVNHPNQLAQGFKAPDTGPASIIQTELVNHHTELSLSEVRIENTPGNHQSLWIPLRKEAIGSRLNLVVYAQDIAASRQPLTESSILNQLKTQVKRTQELPQYVELECEIGQQRLSMMISLKSFKEMGLESGDWIYACFKARALSKII